MIFLNEIQFSTKIKVNVYQAIFYYYTTCIIQQVKKTYITFTLVLINI